MPDVLVTDIAMPNGDGYALIKHVREVLHAESVSLPAVALTAYAREEDRRRAYSAGFQRHLAKPVEPAALVSAISDLARANRFTVEERLRRGRAD